MHKMLPTTPTFMLGESMGGGIDLHASALNPEHLAGVSSSVPGASRFDQHAKRIHYLANCFHLNNRNSHYYHSDWAQWKTRQDHIACRKSTNLAARQRRLYLGLS